MELPADYATDPLKYLPPRIELSANELDLATRYENHDFSGGYMTSQIARFRRGPSANQHHLRRQKFERLKREIESLHLVLPPSFVQLVESDDFVARLRHNTIWLCLPDDLERLPSSPDHILFLIFGEGQGCGYWHLLLDADGGHIVAFSEHHFGLRGFPPGGEPDPASFKVYRCADSFSEWIVRFSAESIAEDRHYEKMLKEFPGM